MLPPWPFTAVALCSTTQFAEEHLAPPCPAAAMSSFGAHDLDGLAEIGLRIGPGEQRAAEGAEGSRRRIVLTLGALLERRTECRSENLTGPARSDAAVSLKHCDRLRTVIGDDSDLHLRGVDRRGPRHDSIVTVVFSGGNS